VDAVRFSDVTADDGPRGHVDGLSWSIPLDPDRGVGVAVVGAADSGPSVILRLLLDLVRPAQGRVEVFGLDTAVERSAIRRRCGYLPADFRVPDELSGLGVLSHLSGLRGGDLPARGLELAERVGLDLDRPVAGLTRGERRRLGVVQALMGRPALLLLDEPTADLDVSGAASVLAVVAEAVAEGAVAVVASRDLRTVRQLADRVLVLHHGRMALDSPAEPLLERVRCQVEVEMADPHDAVDFAQTSPLTDVAVVGSVVRGTVTGDVDDVVKAAARHHTVRLVTHEPDLADRFWAPHAEAS